MAGGAYTALSGLRTRIDQLDRLASDIANVGTAGYKAERVTTVSAERSGFSRALQSAVDVTPGPGHFDFRGGAVSPTGRDLDIALEGRGFFVIDTPAGPRYTRNGQFDLRADGTLTTADGLTVMGESGAIKMMGESGATTLPHGEITVDPDGTVRAGEAVAGKLRVVDFDSYTGFTREDAGRFRAAIGAAAKPATGTTVRGGSLEQSNVSMVERMSQLTEVSRGFEALQRGISVLFNEVDGRAITELGRR